MNFSAKRIWRDVVLVQVRTPAEEIGVPLAANKLVSLVGITGDPKLELDCVERTPEDQ